MSTNAIARRYARALIQLASDQGTVEQYYTELKAFCDALDANPMIGDIFATPGYGIEAKRGIIEITIKLPRHHEMVSAVNRALEIGPKAFDSVGMDRTANVLF